MKKLIFIAMILFMVCGCEKQIIEEHFYEGDHEELFSSLPDKPGEDDEIFIVANDGLYNEKVWDDFYAKAKGQKNCQVVIARYTIEGDVIYELLISDEGGFELYTDNSRDQFSSTAVDPQRYQYLYYYGYTDMEEINGEMKPYEYRYCLLSDKHYENEEAFLKDFNKLSEGEETGLYFAWAYSGLTDKVKKSS